MTVGTILTALCLLVPALPAAPAAPAQDAGPAPQLVADPAEISFGDAFQGEVLHQPVKVTNQGSEPFSVSRIQTSCGCTVPTLTGAAGERVAVAGHADATPIYELAPGASMTIDVEFKTAGKLGLVQQKVSVVGTDGPAPVLSIPLSVRVSTPISVNPPWINFGQVGKGQEASMEVRLNALPIGEWSVTGFEHRVPGRKLPEWLKLEMLDTEGAERRLQVTIGREASVGTFNEQVSILIDHERVKLVDLSVTGMIEPNVTFDTGSNGPVTTVVFDEVAPGGEATRTIRITNQDPSVPYVLQEVEVVTSRDKQDHYVTEIREIEPGVRYEVDLTVKGDIGGGLDESGNVKAPFFRGSLRLLADHADLPRKLLTFHGWVKTSARGG